MNALHLHLMKQCKMDLLRLVSSIKLITILQEMENLLRTLIVQSLLHFNKEFWPTVSCMIIHHNRQHFIFKSWKKRSAIVPVRSTLFILNYAEKRWSKFISALTDSSTQVIVIQGERTLFCFMAPLLIVCRFMALKPTTQGDICHRHNITVVKWDSGFNSVGESDFKAWRMERHDLLPPFCV